MIWLLIDELAEDYECDLFVKAYRNVLDWFKDDKNKHPGILSKNKDTIISHSPSYWLENGNNINFAVVNNFKIIKTLNISLRFSINDPIAGLITLQAS